MENLHFQGRNEWLVKEFEVDDEKLARCKATENLLIAIRKFGFPGLDKARHHPLDCPRRKRAALVESPIEKEFASWSSFMVEVGTFGGKPHRVDSKIDYYSYWQVYQLDAIQQARKPHFYRVPAAAIGWEACMSSQDLSKRNFPKGDILRVTLGFDLLSLYIEARSKGEDLFLKRIGKHGDALVSFSPDEYESLRRERRNYARRLTKASGFTTEELSSFGRRLARLSHEYEERQKATLHKLVLNDLWKLGELTTGFLGLSRDELASNKQFTFFPAAFPDRWEQTKLRTVCLLASFLKEYNDKSGEHLRIEDVKALVDYMDKTNLHFFFASVDLLGKTGFETDLVGRNSAHMALLTMAIALEILMARVIEEYPRTINQLVWRFLSKDPTIDQKVFNHNWKTRADHEGNTHNYLRESCGDANGVGPAFLFENLVIAFRMRNLLAHRFEVFFDPGQERSHEIVRKLYFAFLGVWAFAQKHYHDKLEARATPAC
jgi:hypothetical protein